MTLYNRPQVCFTPDLRLEWLLALVSIFIGCICITTTIILLASSHWDRNVIPYARWVGFTASKTNRRSFVSVWITDGCVCVFLCFSGTVLFCRRRIPNGFPHTGNRRPTVSTPEQPSSGHLVHFVRVVALGNRNIRVVCRQSVSTSFLKNSRRALAVDGGQQTPNDLGMKTGLIREKMICANYTCKITNRLKPISIIDFYVTTNKTYVI